MIILKKYQRVIFTAVLFLVVTMPFREFFSVMAVTEVRPASAFPPAFGLLFGAMGALGCAIGNLAADILSGYPPLMCILGFVAQFLYGYLPYCLWKRMGDTGEQGKSRLKFNCLKNMMCYISIVFIDSAGMAVLLGIMMQGFGISSFFSMATCMFFLNNFVFCMILGIPIIILAEMRGVKKNVISMNERFVLIFLLLGVLSASLIGVFAYGELFHYITDPLTLWNRVYLYISIDLLVFHVITVVFLWYSEHTITIPIAGLTEIAKNYINGADEKTDSKSMITACEPLAKTSGEVGYLADAFRKMFLDLDGYIENLTRITAEKERIGAELSVATQIQADMLPSIFPAFPERNEFDIYASMTPAKEVGGDFYDFFMVDEDHLAVVIADVSGKGVPAALFMVIAKTIIKNHALNKEPVFEVFKNANEQLCENNEEGMFVTAWMGLLTISTGHFEYVNAGHNPPLLKRAKGEFTYLKSRPCFVLAGMEGSCYRKEELMLSAGDILYLYTDGVTEAENAQNELYGEERLKAALERQKSDNPNDILPFVSADIDSFVKEASQFDDITMLCFKYKGTNVE